LATKRTAALLLAIIVIVVAGASIFASSLLNQPRAEKITPADFPKVPERGFFMGVLPVPGDWQSFEGAYSQAAQCSEFVPVWGRPTPFYDLARDLSGSWGKAFVELNIRGKGMFPLVHVTFIGQTSHLLPRHT